MKDKLFLSELDRTSVISYCAERFENDRSYHGCRNIPDEFFGKVYDMLCRPKYNLRVHNDGRHSVYEGKTNDYNNCISHLSILDEKCDDDELEWLLMHEVYCKAEWMDRAPDTAKDYGYKIAE